MRGILSDIEEEEKAADKHLLITASEDVTTLDNDKVRSYNGASNEPSSWISISNLK